MTCASFDRWLDDGRPEIEAASASAHARDCVRCARALDAMLELEAALEVTAPAPPGFTDRVMARVAAVAQERPATAARSPLAGAPLLDSPFAWWVRIAMEPAVVLAAVLAAAVVAFGPSLVRGAGEVGAWLAAAVARAPRLDGPAWPIVAIGLLPVIACASWVIYRWSESLVAKGAPSLRVPRAS